MYFVYNVHAALDFTSVCVGDASETTSFTTLVRAPDTPRAFRVFDRTSSSITLIWNDNDANVGYYVVSILIRIVRCPFSRKVIWNDNNKDNAKSCVVIGDYLQKRICLIELQPF